ncbi:MAG: LOG family protein [Armatimonadetes bacterium]|nr:LOG family protein [Armatimonadota bacterium]
MRYRYSTGDPAVDEAIERMIRGYAPDYSNADLIHQMIVTALKLVSDDADRGDLKILNTTMKEMRYSFKVFRPYRRARKVSVFGSARTPEESDDYKQAREFSAEMARHGFMSITGAGHGIMKAGHVGAGREKSFGVNIRLPFEQVANEVIAGDEKLVNFKYFFTRKLAFLKETHAVVCFPGGFGTHDEGFEALTLVQTGKSHILPIVFIHPRGASFWYDWDCYVKDRLLARGMISAEDLSLYRVTDDVQVACAEILRFYRRYHSMRYVGDDLVIRLESALKPEELAALNLEFGDLVKSGRIEPTAMLPEETSDPDIDHLPRLRLKFPRRRFGRLRQLIDRINGFPLPPDTHMEVPEAGEGGQIPDEVDDPEVEE